MLNVVVALWQRLDNVGRATLSQRSNLTSVQLSFSTVRKGCDNVNNDVVTTLSQRHCASWEIGTVSAVTTKNYTDGIIFMENIEAVFNCS